MNGVTHRRVSLPLATLSISLTTLLLSFNQAVPAVAQARPLNAPPPAFPGEVLALEQTPHLWVADQQGVAHLAGDPVALAAHPVDWKDRRDITKDELGAMPRGEPWLSMSLVRLGEAIYLPRQTGDGAPPTLAHVTSADDLALMGVTAENYGQLVLDRPAWEQRYGYDAARLQVDGDLSLDSTAPATMEVPPPPTTRDDTVSD
jgi:hypothetical protein